MLGFEKMDEKSRVIPVTPEERNDVRIETYIKHSHSQGLYPPD